MADAQTPQEYAGERLEHAREEAGRSLGDAAFAVRLALGPRLAITGQQIRNYELGRTAEHHWNPLVIKVLCDDYGVPIEEVSEIAAAAWTDDQPRLLSLVNPRNAGSEGDSGGPATSAVSQSAENPRDVEFSAQAA